MGDRSKKNKKAKGKVVSLQDFLATSTSAGTTQVPVKIRSWADECEDDEPVRTQLIQLPTAPRASRILNDDTIPTVAPFTAFISNLPYEVNEDEIEEFFAEENIVIKHLSLPRDDNASGRLKGFGNIEFECREDLIDALSISNPTIRNRRIRINLPTEQDGKSGGRNRNYDNYNKSSGDNDNTNWRERGREGDFDPNEPRENRRNYNRDYNKDRGNRDRNNRDRDGEEREEGGNWRANRPNVPDSPPPERKQYGNRRGGGGGRFNDRRGGDRDRDEMPQERPKIILKPRTLPLPEMHFPAEEELDSGRVKKSLDLNDNKENHNGQEEQVEERPKPKPVPAESIFGQAKPVDTAAREREIEERLERERLRKLKEAEEDRERQRKESEETKSNENYEDEEHQQKPREEEEKLPAPVKKEEDYGSWRKQAADNGPTNDDSRPRRIDNRDNRDLRDNRPKSSKDNRNRDYNRDRNDRDRNDRDRERNDRDRDRDRDYGRGGMNRDRNDRRRDDRDRDRDRDRPMIPKNRPPRMERERERERERDPKDIEERMPKLKPSSGPNLSITNAFEGLKSEDEAD